MQQLYLVASNVLSVTLLSGKINSKPALGRNEADKEARQCYQNE